MQTTPIDERDDPHLRALLQLQQGTSPSAAITLELIAKGYARLQDGTLLITSAGIRHVRNAPKTAARPDERAKHLGELLRWYRQRSGKSIAQITQALELSRSTLYAYEQGDRTPNAHMLLDLTAYLGINPSDFAAAFRDDASDTRHYHLVRQGIPVGPSVKEHYLANGWAIETDWGALALTDAGIAACRRHEHRSGRQTGDQAVA